MKKSSKTAATAATLADRLDGFLCFGVYSTGLAFNRVYKPRLDELGLTYSQYLVMLSLWHQDDQAVGELGDKLFLESNTLTPLLKRLEASGFVTRRRGSADERIVRVTLTKRGRQVAEQAACLPEKILEATGVSREDLAKIQQSLVAIRENLRTAVGDG
jgi:MarR family transcriptional regulator, organic hydroperoxide resistance regulator